MSFFSDTFSNPITGALAGGLVLGAPGAVGGGVFGALNRKNNMNSQIDSEMTPLGAPPAPLDPNDMGTPNASGSPYAQLAYNRNNTSAALANDQAATGAGGQAAGARSALASRGGITSGAAERVGVGAVNAGAQMKQANNASLNEANANVGMNDENQRVSAYNAIRQGNQNMRNNVYGANMLSNATLQNSKPTGLLGLGILGL